VSPDKYPGFFVKFRLVIYLTYNDQPSGIYTSQVIDVVKYMNSIGNKDKVKLVALISGRNFSKNKLLIQSALPESSVYPMVPKAGLWRLNYFILFFIFLFSSHKKVMARGPFAAALALRLKKNGLVKKVIFDGRGAYKAELNEYEVVNDEKVKREIAEIEREVVLSSDHRLSVSNALVTYWKKEFGYEKKDHVIIPCTLSNDFSFEFPSADKLKAIRSKLGYNENDIVVVYSGSSAGWQSFSLIENMLQKWMTKDERVKLLWMTNKLDESSAFVKQFRNRINTAWVKPSEVPDYLLAGDHGLLFRENTVTNLVASPVKFAEYLYCGLNVVISEDLGDFSEFVKQHNCGSIGVAENLSKTDHEQKRKNHELAGKYLTKEVYKDHYMKLLSL
jgi:hypothetical protein